MATSCVPLLRRVERTREKLVSEAKVLSTQGLPRRHSVNKHPYAVLPTPSGNGHCSVAKGCISVLPILKWVALHMFGMWPEVLKDCTFLQQASH